MAQALGWPDQPIGWETMVELAADPQGWLRYGRPEWGQFRFGHTHQGTIWAEHPYCILDNADWVSEGQKEAATIFRDYLLAPEQQRLAISNYLRSLDSSIALHAPMDLDHGTDPRVTTSQIPPLPSPDARVSEAVIDLFLITKRKATVLIVLDASGSMRGEFIKTATAAAVEFLRRLHPEDIGGVMLFSHEVTMLAEPERVSDVVETLAERVNGVVLSPIASLTHGRVFNADPESISNVYVSISAEQ